MPLEQIVRDHAVAVTLAEGFVNGLTVDPICVGTGAGLEVM